jgi:hypothetical protein
MRDCLIETQLEPSPLKYLFAHSSAPIGPLVTLEVLSDIFASLLQVLHYRLVVFPFFFLFRSILTTILATMVACEISTDRAEIALHLLPTAVTLERHG